MKVKIKTFDVAMELKQNGVELEVKSPDGSTHYGDCFITMKGLTWCEGRKRKPNGVDITWKQIMEIGRSEQSLKAALKAAKEAE